MAIASGKFLLNRLSVGERKMKKKNRKWPQMLVIWLDWWIANQNFCETMVTQGTTDDQDSVDGHSSVTSHRWIGAIESFWLFLVMEKTVKIHDRILANKSTGITFVQYCR